MLILMSVASASCGLGMMAPLPLRMKQSNYSYRARVVDLEPVPRRRRRTSHTRATLAVREVYNGDVPDVVFATFYGQPRENWHRENTEHVPVLGDELIVMTNEHEPRLWSSCNRTPIVPPGSDWPYLTPLRSRPLPPGPKDHYLEALARCDMEGIQKGIEGKLRIPLTKLASCPTAAIDLYMKPAGPFSKLPPGVVERADTKSLLSLLDEHPEAGADAMTRAMASGRVDLLTAAPHLVTRFPAQTTLYEVAPIPELIALLLEHKPRRQDELHQALSACFHHSILANREQRHDAARKLLAAGAPPASPNAWPAVAVFFHAVEDGFPTHDILEMLQQVPREHYADAVRTTLERAAQFGRLDLVQAVWDGFEHPTILQHFADAPCHHSLASMNYVHDLLPQPTPEAGTQCAEHAIESGSLEVLEFVLASHAIESWERPWSLAWRYGHRPILERLHAEHPRPASRDDLTLAIRSGRAAAVSYALELGAPLTNENGQSALGQLLLGLRYDNGTAEDADIARVLFSAGTPPEALSPEQWSSLQHLRPALYAVLREHLPKP